jgi:hypothetical protein
MFAMALALTACGGGGTSTNLIDSAGNTTTLKGTVAIGAPLGMGTVTIMDSGGRSIKTSTDENGLYSVDISSLTAPLILEFDGYSPLGVPIKIYSTNDAKLNGKANIANITPITDAMLTIITGQSGSSFYKQPNFDKIKAESISQANNLIANKLSSLLAATGSKNDINFIKTEFDANKSGHDMLLELVQLNTMPAKSNSVSPSIMIAGTLANGSVEITPPSGGAVAVANSTVNGSIQANALMPLGINFNGIDDLIKNVNASLSSNSSVVSKLEALTDDGFIQDGENKNAVWTNAVAQGFSNLTLSKGSILGCNFSDPFVCEVSFLAKSNDFAVLPRQFKATLAYKNGSWIFYGNRNKFNSYVKTTYYNSVEFTANGSTSTPYVAFETFFSTEGLVASNAVSGKLYAKTASNWLLLGTLNKLNNSFGTVGINSFVYSEFQPTDAMIDTLYEATIATGSLQIKLDIFDNAANIINSQISYNMPLPMKKGQLLNMDFIGLSTTGLDSLKTFTGQNKINMNLEARGGSFQSIGLNKNWIDTSNMSINQSSTNLKYNSVDGAINFSNSMTLAADKFRAIDMFGQDAQGRRQHVKYHGCNADLCNAN